MTCRPRLHRSLAALAGVLGALAVVSGEPYPGDPGPRRDERVREVGVLEVARWLRDGSAGVRLVDVRGDSQFATYHLPGADHVPMSTLRGAEWRRDRTVVVYADDGPRAAEAAGRLRAAGVQRAYVLRGGLLAWIDSIAEPRLATLPATATPEEQAARREHLELSRYFGGMPVVSRPTSTSPTVTTPRPAAPLPSRPSQEAAVARMLRRGC